MDMSSTSDDMREFMTRQIYNNLTEEEERIQEAGVRVQMESTEIIRQFLEKHIPDGLIFQNATNARLWLNEIYPEINEETEEDEKMISAFIAGMLFIVMNGPEEGFRWIFTLDNSQDMDDSENRV